MNKYLLRLIVLSIIGSLYTCIAYSSPVKPNSKVVIYPAPAGEALSQDYKVSIAGRNVPVYQAKIGAADNVRRFKAVDDLPHSEEYFDVAAFAYFDMQGSATITVTVPANVSLAKILPSSAGVKPVMHGHTITFTVTKPQNLTIEINGEWVKSLHIFANPIETDIPKPNDPNVLFFGPGVHEVSSQIIGDNKIVYIAGGAIVKEVIGKDEKFGFEPSGLRNYGPRLLLNGHHIKFRGRGILDASACPVHSAHMITIHGSDITVEGVILRNSSTWTSPIFQSDHVHFNNVKFLGYRANSDGIDICNSHNVIIEKCFVRTNDDLIVVKTEEGQGPAEHIVVKNCILWNQLAHPLSIGAELRENVNDVLFTGCDIIHDQGREWSLRVFQSDASHVSNIRFENIRIEESHRLISLWIGKNANSLQKGVGSIDHISFKNIVTQGSPLSIELIGGDAQNGINNLLFQHIMLNGKPLTNTSMINTNAFATNITVIP